MELVGVIQDREDRQASPTTCCCLNPTKREVYTGHQDAVIKAWDFQIRRVVRNFIGHTGWITSLVYLPRANCIVSGSLDTKIGVWTARGTLSSMIEVNGPVNSMSYSHVGEWLVVGSHDRVLFYKVLFTEELRAGPTLELTYVDDTHTDIVACMMCVGDMIFTGGYDRNICVYDAEQPLERIRQFSNCHSSSVIYLAYNARDSSLMSSSFNHDVKFWSLEGTEKNVFRELGAPVTSMCEISSTNQLWFATGHTRPTVYDAQSGRDITGELEDNFFPPRPTLEAEAPQRVTHLLSLPDTHEVIGITNGGKIYIWKYDMRSSLLVMRGHDDWIDNIDYRLDTVADGDVNFSLFTCCGDKTIRRWECRVRTGTGIQHNSMVLANLDSPAVKVVYHRPLDSLISIGRDSEIRVWMIETQGLVRRLRHSSFEGHEGRVEDITLAGSKHPDILISVGIDGSIRFWNMTAGHSDGVLMFACKKAINAVQFCEEKDQFTTCGRDGSCTLWSYASREKVLNFQGHSSQILSMRYNSPKNLWIGMSESGEVLMWTPMGLLVRSLKSKMPLTCFECNHYTGDIVCASSDHMIRVYDPSDLHVVMEYVGHGDMVKSVLHIPEARKYVSISHDRTVRVWDVLDREFSTRLVESQRKKEMFERTRAAASEEEKIQGIKALLQPMWERAYESKKYAEEETADIAASTPPALRKRTNTLPPNQRVLQRHHTLVGSRLMGLGHQFRRSSSSSKLKIRSGTGRDSTDDMEDLTDDEVYAKIDISASKRSPEGKGRDSRISKRDLGGSAESGMLSWTSYTGNRTISPDALITDDDVRMAMSFPLSSPNVTVGQSVRYHSDAAPLSGGALPRLPETVTERRTHLPYEAVIVSPVRTSFVEVRKEDALGAPASKSLNGSKTSAIAKFLFDRSLTPPPRAPPRPSTATKSSGQILSRSMNEKGVIDIRKLTSPKRNMSPENERTYPKTLEEVVLEGSSALEYNMEAPRVLGMLETRKSKGMAAQFLSKATYAFNHLQSSTVGTPHWVGEPRRVAEARKRTQETPLQLLERRLRKEKRAEDRGKDQKRREVSLVKRLQEIDDSILRRDDDSPVRFLSPDFSQVGKRSPQGRRKITTSDLDDDVVVLSIPLS